MMIWNLIKKRCLYLVNIIFQISLPLRKDTSEKPKSSILVGWLTNKYKNSVKVKLQFLNDPKLCKELGIKEWDWHDQME